MLSSTLCTSHMVRTWPDILSALTKNGPSRRFAGLQAFQSYVNRKYQSPMFCLANTTTFESVIAKISLSLSPRV